MTTKLLTRGYATETYEVQAGENEVLTREGLEEKMGNPFGCRVEWCNGTQARVVCYTD